MSMSALEETYQITDYKVPLPVDDLPTGFTALQLLDRDLARVPRLTAEEETDLSSRALEGDVEARNRLAEGNMRLVLFLVGRYEGLGIPEEDLVQIGSIGLLGAAEKFDASTAKFGAYAGPSIKNAITTELKTAQRQKRVPREALVSIDELAESAVEGKAPLELAEEVDHIEMSEEKLLQAQRAAGLSVAMKGLSRKQRRVLELRFGLGGQEPLSQEEAAAVIGVSRARIGQVENKALGKLEENAGEQLFPLL
jgi:RNA polymerase sigma factor (sigma-70 family)